MAKLISNSKSVGFSLLFIFSILESSAQPTWTSAANGLWHNTETWTKTGGATGAPPTTLSGNQRIIINSHNVTVGGGGSNLLFDGTSTISIINGGQLTMGDAGLPAPTLTMKNINNVFTMTNGIYESYSGGSGGNMVIEKGTINWQLSSLYISGNYSFLNDSYITMINICLRSAQNQEFIGVGSSTNYAVLNNVYHIAGISGTGNIYIQSSSYITATNLRFVVGSTSGSVDFSSSTMNGSIFTIYGNEAINVSSMSGTTTLDYRCADAYNYSPAWFTGSQTVNCSIAADQICGTGVLYAISGTVFNDGNGGVISGPGIGTADGNQLYVSLTNGAGTIIGTRAVNINGTYTFNNLGPGNYYSVVLHTNPSGSSVSTLPANWVNTAEGIVSAGDGLVNGTISTFSIPASVSTANFGIQKIPESDIYITVIPQPVVNQFKTLNGGANPPALSGNDREDCGGNCVLTNKNLMIDAVPTNSELYYNSTIVINGQQINGFDPSLLQVKFTTATMGHISTSFLYSFIDAADLKDPTPATYTLMWERPLPVKLISFTATLAINSVDLKWITSSEINVSHFIVEKSTDGINYSDAGMMFAYGNASNMTNYSLSDNISGTQSKIIYYRLRSIDVDGKSELSATRIIRTGKENKSNITILAYPNPVSNEVRITIPANWQNKKVVYEIYNASGKTAKKVETASSSQTETINVSCLAPGFYIVRVSFDGQTAQQKIIKK